MKTAFSILWDYISDIFYILFDDGLSLISPEFAIVMNNPKERKKYFKAVKKAKKTGKEQIINLSIGKLHVK